ADLRPRRVSSALDTGALTLWCTPQPYPPLSFFVNAPATPAIYTFPYTTLFRSLPGAIAYFSAEFGITGALPQYSGGLGILAGDHLKSASDLAPRSSGSGCSTVPATSASRSPGTGGRRRPTRC